MYHEATACHVYNEILDLLGIIFEFLKCLHDYRSEKEVQNYLMACKDWSDIIKKLFTLLNSYSCGEMRRIVMGTCFFVFIRQFGFWLRLFQNNSLPKFLFAGDYMGRLEERAF